jgi:hypothetical protein
MASLERASKMGLRAPGTGRFIRNMADADEVLSTMTDQSLSRSLERLQGPPVTTAD